LPEERGQVVLAAIPASLSPSQATMIRNFIGRATLNWTNTAKEEITGHAKTITLGAKQSHRELTDQTMELVQKIDACDADLKQLKLQNAALQQHNKTILIDLEKSKAVKDELPNPRPPACPILIVDRVDANKKKKVVKKRHADPWEAKRERNAAYYKEVLKARRSTKKEDVKK
jgi:hypothetical protein